ncbi:DUF2804 domain-containing protein [Marinobacter zhejiangensis]|uniref:DUF2804 domain-containing protein n=1 Tax=Marinobacter zhejiangensis TaxID=488535 RepID=A0A1I4N737_9GAMM|nr:DUF2804 domain-containing protein [Marinobacter zhejiangensis]SFM11309.1 Protein of unknown function [Marinobacter zhejiangensis]
MSMSGVTSNKLIDDNGRVRTGVLQMPIDEVNYLDYDLRTVMDRPRSALARRWRFNQFQFVSAMGPDWLFGLAIVDLKLVSNAFFYLYDFRTGEMLERSLLQPLAWRTDIAPRPETGKAVFVQGSTRITIEPGGSGRRVTVEDGNRINIDLQMTGDEDPLRMASQAGYNGWVFTRKSAGLPVTGSVRWEGREFQCGDNWRGAIDWSCGYMRRETAWNWASLAGCTADGHSVGLNLAAGVNETGVTENALWLDGRCIKLEMAQFEFDRYDPSAPWRVTTTDGRVDLRFVPSGVRKERMDVLLMASNFRQYAGTFEGEVRDELGNVVTVSGLRGLMEDHYARW